MSFLTKYLEYSLPSESLTAWYQFASEEDSGPNGNDPVSLSGSGYISSGKAVFTNHWLRIALGEKPYFTAFFDLTLKSKGDTILFSNRNSSGNGFFFGYSGTSGFFIFCRNASVSFFKYFKVKTGSRSILSLDRSDNQFSLSVFNPNTEEMETDFISVPWDFQIPESDLKLSQVSSSSTSFFDQTSVFDLNQFAIIETSVPIFVVRDLCLEIYLNESSPQSELAADFLVVDQKVLASTFSVSTGNSYAVTGLDLRYANFEGGFSLEGLEIDSNPKFWRNGALEVPLISGGFAYFSGQSSTDYVILDNFGSGVSTGISSAFTGFRFGKVEIDAPLIFNSGLRKNTGFVTASSMSDIFGQNIPFGNATLLAQI